MSIKSSEYIAIVKSTHLKLSQFQIEDEFFVTLDEIRKSHARYRKHAKYIALYPNHSLGGRDGYKDLRPAGEQLIEDCKRGEVEYLFKDINHRNYKRFVEYIYRNVNITDLIDV